MGGGAAVARGHGAAVPGDGVTGVAGAMWRDGATVWHPVRGGFERRVLAGCRVEASKGVQLGQAGPSASPALSLYARGDAGVVPGDWVCAGVWRCPEPPEGCPRATSVCVRTLGGAAHHTEVSAS